MPNHSEGSIRQLESEEMWNSELLTVGDFLSRYSISRSGFYREVNRGAIPLVKLGTATRIARADAEAWLASLPVKQGSAAHG